MSRASDPWPYDLGRPAECGHFEVPDQSKHGWTSSVCVSRSLLHLKFRRTKTIFQGVELYVLNETNLFLLATGNSFCSQIGLVVCTRICFQTCIYFSRSGIHGQNLAELHGNTSLEICKTCGREFLRDFGCKNHRNALKEHETGT